MKRGKLMARFMRTESYNNAMDKFSEAKDEFKKAEEFREQEDLYMALTRYQQAAVIALQAYLYYKIESSVILVYESITELIETAVNVEADFDSISKTKKLDRLSRIVIPHLSLNDVYIDEQPTPGIDDPLEVQEGRELSTIVLDFIQGKFDSIE